MTWNRCRKDGALGIDAVYQEVSMIAVKRSTQTFCKIIAIIALNLSSSHVLADDLPNYDLAPSCRIETVTAAGDRSCMRDEQTARATLLEQWSQFAPSDRTRCQQLEESGGAPSYVELLTCLQEAAAAKKLPPGLLNTPP
jgi:hypothetical protein